MLPRSVPFRLFSLHAALSAACIAGWGLAPPAAAQSGPGAATEEPAPARRQEPLPRQELTQDLLYRFLIAEVAAQRGNLGVAAQTYLDLARRTRDPRIARRTVEIASAARLQNLAIDAAKQWRDAEPGSAQALQVLSGLLVAARRVEEAEPHLAQLFGLSGDSPANGFMQLQRLLAGNPDKQANLRLVRHLAGRYPDLPQAHYALAQAAIGAGDESLALASVRRAAQLRPSWEQPVILEAQILQRSSPQAAVARLAEFIEKNPQSTPVRLVHARALVAAKQNAEARRVLESLIKQNPDDPETVQTVGLAALQLKDYALAESSMRRLLELGLRDPNGILFTLGQIAEEQKNWPQAIEWYRQITRGEQALAARLRTGHALAKQGRVDEARSYLQSVAAETPEQQTQVLVTEAQLLREANRAREAFDVLGKALERNPEQAELLYDLALTAEKLERFDVLESKLKQLIQLRPDNAHAYNALGYSFADRNLRLDEARKLIERALELAPEDFYIIDSLGWVLYRQGDLKGALQQLRRAWQGRQDAEIGAHLGEVLWVTGARDEARRIWDEALRADPDNQTLQKTIKRFQL